MTSKSTKTAQRRPAAPAAAGTKRVDDRHDQRVRLAVLVTVLGCLLLFWRGEADAFGTPKLTWTLLGVVAVLGLAGAEAVRTRRLVIPWTPAAALAGAFALVCLGTAAAGGLGWISFLGPYTRYVGALPYLSYVVLFLAILRFGTQRWLRDLAWWLTIGLGLIALYGLLQAANLDPFEWSDAGSLQAFSTLGQENFAAGATAALLPMAVGSFFLSEADSLRRYAAAAVTVAGTILVWRTNSFQGPVAGIVAVAPIATVALLERRTVRDDGASPLKRALLVLGGLIAAAGLLLGPNIASRIGGQLSSGTQERRYLWEAALTMIRKRPVLGGGFGRYALRFPELRPAGHAFRYGILRADAPHNVLLDLAVSGGLVLVAVYLAFVLYTGWCLVGGLRRTGGEQRRLLAVFGGGWLGYQVQSLVSIDVPPVAILHFVFAGAVILLSRPVELRVFGSDRPPSRNDAASTAGAVVIGALALLGAWLVLRPLRADVAAADARNLQTSGAKPALRVEQLRHAVGLAPWEPRYVVALAAAYQAEGQSNDALETGERAARLDPGNTTSAIAAANAAEALGAQPRAEQWYRTAVRHDPHYAGAHDALGRYLGRMNRRQESVRALRRATQLSPSTASYWRDYGEALAGVRRYEPAVAALERALEIEPNWPAQQLLEQLKRALATQG